MHFKKIVYFFYKKHLKNSIIIFSFQKSILLIVKLFNKLKTSKIIDIKRIKQKPA